MRRGDVVTVAAGSGFGGKPRPALVVQSNAYDALPTVVVALFTTTLTDAPLTRPRIAMTAANGLFEESDLMIDILVTVRREKIDKVIGRLDADDQARADLALMVFLGVAD